MSAISLNWPDRDKEPEWTADGWRLRPSASDEAIVSVEPLLVTNGGDPALDPWVITGGEPMRVLEALERVVGQRVQLAYVDAPRLETNASDFPAAEPTARLNTWLTVMQATIRRVFPLLGPSGSIAVLCGIDELPFVQQLLIERFGMRNHVGTIAWQKGYSPRNLQNMRKVSPTHDNIVVFAKSIDALRPVNLETPPKGYSNNDGDPRGEWIAEQKGAAKPDCDFDVHIPPYRWRVVEGALPPGIWRVNERSGVIFGRDVDIRTPGTWEFTMEVADKVGSVVARKFTISIRETGEAPPPMGPDWLVVRRDDKGNVANAPRSGGNLAIETVGLPDGVVGRNYHACLHAAGGDPWSGTTRPGKMSTSGKGRYWEYPAKTLQKAAADDTLYFPRKVDGIPTIKRYREAVDYTPLNQASAWVKRGDPLDVGFAQRAKKELEALRVAGIIDRDVSFAKPSSLMTRLLALFTQPDGLVLDLGSPAGEMGAMAVATRRRAVYVPFATPDDVLRGVVLPRLANAASGLHPLPASVLFRDGSAPHVAPVAVEDADADDDEAIGEAPDGADEDADGSETGPEDSPVTDGPKTKRKPARAKATSNKSAHGYYVGASRPALRPGAGVCEFELGAPAALIDHRARTIQIDWERYSSATPEFTQMLASLEGLVPLAVPEPHAFAMSWDRWTVAAYVPASTYLDGAVLSRLLAHHADHVARGGHVRIYYQRGMDSASATEGRVDLRRVPFDLKTQVTR